MAVSSTTSRTWSQGSVVARCYDGDVEAGIWSVGTAMGLINDIPTVGELVTRIVDEAEELIIGRLDDMVESAESERVPA